ncbi:MAG: MltA domain-containing protein [Desulfarculales bacterium]|jgi:membrane-bound lytic murein transglycosylase A|nr:MltA domain-containing protein [Desulfarculales bacterium]
MRPLALICICLVFIAACADDDAPSPPAFKLVTPAEWPLMEDDMDPESLEAAASPSLEYLNSLGIRPAFSIEGRSFSGAELARAWARAVSLRRAYSHPRQFSEALQREFDLYQSKGRNHQGDVLFTGYYEPILEGSLDADEDYRWPLYSLPGDLVTVDLKFFGDDLPPRRLVGRLQDRQIKPYPERAAIDFQDALAGAGEPLAYLRDPLDAFFLHIQGSGQIKLTEGSLIRLGYAGQNGRPYRSIGALLLAEGAINKEDMSMQSIRRYLGLHPERIEEVLSANPSYVFFRLLSPEGGPLGAYERPLTPGRSVAYDRDLFPPMGLAFIRTQRPGQGNCPTGPINRLVWGQDTGGAIKGPGRVDLFWGSGREAEEEAGRMQSSGQIYFLLPKPSS